mmetsp:Transcript_94157/g.239638  ORF Transcript_94157/g.239638 Transcript_94157/m.239638 type:complete len:373 (-) Transcript_94157:968-2086(-)
MIHHVSTIKVQGLQLGHSRGVRLDASTNRGRRFRKHHTCWTRSKELGAGSGNICGEELLMLRHNTRDCSWQFDYSHICIHLFPRMCAHCDGIAHVGLRGQCVWHCTKAAANGSSNLGHYFVVTLPITPRRIKPYLLVQGVRAEFGLACLAHEVWIWWALRMKAFASIHLLCNLSETTVGTDMIGIEAVCATIWKLTFRRRCVHSIRSITLGTRGVHCHWCLGSVVDQVEYPPGVEFAVIGSFRRAFHVPFLVEDHLRTLCRGCSHERFEIRNGLQCEIIRSRKALQLRKGWTELFITPNAYDGIELHGCDDGVAERLFDCHRHIGDRGCLSSTATQDASGRAVVNGIHTNDGLRTPTGAKVCEPFDGIEVRT